MSRLLPTLALVFSLLGVGCFRPPDPDAYSNDSITKVAIRYIHALNNGDSKEMSKCLMPEALAGCWDIIYSLNNSLNISKSNLKISFVRSYKNKVWMYVKGNHADNKIDHEWEFTIVKHKIRYINTCSNMSN